MKCDEYSANKTNHCRQTEQANSTTAEMRTTQAHKEQNEYIYIAQKRSTI